MSKRCEICDKSKLFGNQISFSHRKSRRSWSPNIQRVKAVVDGTTKRINVERAL
mgnify:FL=1